MGIQLGDIGRELVLQMTNVPQLAITEANSSLTSAVPVVVNPLKDGIMSSQYHNIYLKYKQV